jgi:hypothetical protein
VKGVALTREELDQLWSNPDNWTVVYHCREDPRVIVPKRRPSLGWTLNFAHPLAIPALLIALLLPILPVILLIRYHLPIPRFIVAMAACISLLVLLCHWEATRSRQ